MEKIKHNIKIKKAKGLENKRSNLYYIKNYFKFKPFDAKIPK